MSEKDKVLCIICAWRATCLKQFSMKAGYKCPEFVKDVAIKEEGQGSGSKQQAQ